MMINCTLQSRVHRFRRRAGVYVLFLGCSLLVSIIAISAMTLMRIDLTIAEDSNHLALAQSNAQSAVDQGLLAIYSSSSWRTSISHNTWSTAQAISGGTMSWKLVDEVNNSLTVSRNARVRVYGKGVHGTATWVMSVEVQPPPEVVPTNALVNGDLETGVVTPWVAKGSCSLSIGTAPQAGARCLRVLGRSANAAASQPIASLVSGDRCQLSAWTISAVSNENVWMQVCVTTAAGTSVFEAARVTTTTNWSQMTGTVTPTWAGDMISAEIKIGTDGFGDFKIDTVSMVCIPGPVGIVPGSWRREAQ